ncbi:alpha/beta hydrolase fold protein [Desulfatibacillum aliphaticivorans]|uniref:2-succinyl-6-hydroxy-2,4-cyclohexadiene-1-carboxylate synthase n=1 Tax=Desulfatibacillum aliphaticivorans TaxID=218208 RepID=B8FA14_DESAL|nr:2-succinyl-6-hydroxy-2,4-cyclohexadiene-1-carboxylate synthase [Desulfatibacillum aliphaticivorans]ACL03110.1 alpha/beta hydrolase fold protein [Desulfatibacillum aliphaticivorans]
MKLHAQTYGNPQKPPLVMLHGFMGRGQSFAPLIPLLEPHFFLITPDLPGHGRSLFSQTPQSLWPKNLEDAGKLVLKSLDAMSVKSFFLYGYSMGGRIAQQVCLLAPDRVRCLILESAGLGIPDPEERKARKKKDDALLDGVKTAGDFHRFLEKWHRLPLFCTLWDSPLLSGLTASKQKNNVTDLAQALKVLGVGNHPWFGPDLAKLDVSITYLYGEKDAKYSQEAQKASEIIPRLDLAPFSGASHNVHIQFPAQAAETVIRASGLTP